MAAAAQAHRRHRRGELRAPQRRPDLRPAHPPGRRGHRHHARRRVLQRRLRPHLDGDRGTGHYADRRRPPSGDAQHSPDPTLNGPNLVFVRLRSRCSSCRPGSPTSSASPTPPTATSPPCPTGAGTGNTVVGGRRAASGGDRELPHDGRHARRCWPSALAAGAVVALGLTLAASVRRRRRDLALLEDARLHPTPAGGGRGLAGVGGRRHRDRGRRAARDRHRALAVDPLRPPDLRRAATHGAGRVGGRSWRSARWCLANVVAALPGT